MRLRSNVTIVALAVLLAVLAAPGRADDLAEKGREVFKNNQRAIVTVQIVIKTKFSVPGMGGQSNESKQDLTGTVVDASGLTVLALSACEPGDMIQSIIAGISGEDGDSGVPLKMDTELSDVKILLDDGTEMRKSCCATKTWTWRSSGPRPGPLRQCPQLTWPNQGGPRCWIKSLRSTASAKQPAAPTPFRWTASRPWS